MPRPNPHSTENYLVPKSRLNLKPITLRLPAALLDEVNVLRERAEIAGFVLDLPVAVAEALTRTVEQVKVALERLEAGGNALQKPVVEGKRVPRGMRKPELGLEAGVQQ